MFTVIAIDESGTAEGFPTTYEAAHEIIKLLKGRFGIKYIIKEIQLNELTKKRDKEPRTLQAINAKSSF